MSKDVDRDQVFKTTRVRTALKNDFSWIQKSQEKKEEEDKASTDHDVETRPVPVKQHSYIPSTIKKLDDSANQANGEAIFPQKHAQPEGSTVETTDDTKPQAPTEELIQNGEAQPEKSVLNTPAENKEEYADTAVYRSNLKRNEGAGEVSANGHVEEHMQNAQVQPVSSAKENPEAVLPPVEPAEQPVAITSAEKKQEYADTTSHQSNVEHNEANFVADAHVEDPVAENSASAGTAESKDTAEVPAALAVKLKPEEGPSTKTEAAYVESTVQPAEGSHPEQAAEEVVEAVAEVVVESSPDKRDVINATPGEEVSLQDHVESVPDLVAETLSETPTEPAAETAVKSVECKVESAASAEPVLKTRAEEVVECQIQPPDNTVVKQSVESIPESTAERVGELNIEDAVEAVTASGAEAVQDEVACRATELTDALDVKPARPETGPEPLKDPKQSHTKETKLNQPSDDTNISEMFQKPVEEV